jgi:diguanylate cyclase (GGDEF)-like protein
MFIDLDGFKGINDQFGHASGDELLRQVASRLTSMLRTSDVAARIGGDEFTVALSDTTPEHAKIVADKLVAGLSCPYLVNMQNLRISASIGIAASAAGSISVEELVRTADDAMYVVKAAGKAGVHTCVLM